MNQTRTIMSRNGNSGEVEIDLIAVLQSLLGHVLPIILVTVICGVLSFFGTKLFITPKYESQFTAYVNNRSGGTEDVTSLSNADLAASQSLVSTYSRIIVSNSVLQAAAENVGIDMTYEKLVELVETDTDSGTEVICVKVKGYSPSMAQRFAQAIAEQAQVQISNIVDGTSMRIIDSPMLPAGTCSPSYLKNVVIAAFVGFFFACVVYIVVDIMDDRIRSEQTAEKALGFIIIGTIPNCKQAMKVGDNYGYGYGRKRHPSGKTNEGHNKRAFAPANAKTKHRHAGVKK